MMIDKAETQSREIQTDGQQPGVKDRQADGQTDRQTSSRKKGMLRD